MTPAKTVLVVFLAAIPALPVAAADDPGAAAATRFLECLAGEGVLLEEAERNALRVAIEAQFGASYGDIDCVASPGACSTAIASASCEDLAAAWAPQVLGEEAAVEAPAWAVTYGEALATRVRSCYAEESGAAPSGPEEASIASWQGMLASQLGQMTTAMSCTVNEGALAQCTSAITAQPCSALAGNLDPDGPGAAVNEACAELFVCENRADAVDDIIRGENTVVE